MMDLSMDDLTAPVTPQELDAWLRSTCVDDEPEEEPAPVNNMKARRPPLPKLSELGPTDGSYKPSCRRRSSLDLSGHSFGIDAQTALMLDEIDQDTTIEEHCVRLVSDGSLNCNDDFASPASSVGQESVSRDAALSVEPTPLFAFDRRDTGGTSCSSDTVVRNNFARTVSDREDYARKNSSGSHHSQCSTATVYAHSASCPGNQNALAPPRLHHSQSMPVPSSPQDFNPFLSAMEKSQKSQEFIHSEVTEVSSRRSIGLMRQTSRSRELLLNMMSSSVSNRASGGIGRGSSQVAMPATPRTARESMSSRDCLSAPVSRRSSMETTSNRRSSFIQNRRTSGAGSWRQRDMRNVMLRSIADNEEDAMREDLIRIGQKAARRMSWKGHVRMDPVKTHFSNFLASGKAMKNQKQTNNEYPAKPNGFVDNECAVQAELRRIAREQMMEMGEGRATAA